MTDSAQWLVMSKEDFEEAYRPDPGEGNWRAQRSYLHRVLIRALESALERIPADEELERKPLILQLAVPLPAKLSFYIYEATQHESERQEGTFKVQLTAGLRRPGSGSRRFFDRTAGARVVLIGYHPDHELFILWDADLHELAGGFPDSKNVQAPPNVVWQALANGWAEGSRRLRVPSVIERIVASRPRYLVSALQLRIRLSNQTLLEENV